MLNIDIFIKLILGFLFTVVILAVAISTIIIVVKIIVEESNVGEKDERNSHK